MANGSTGMVEEPGIDLEITEAMVAELEPYIVNDDLYRTLIVHTAHGDQNVRMTGGDLLARLHRLHGERVALTLAQAQRLDAAQAAADATIYSLRTRFHQRLAREMKARLDALRWFLDECEADLQRGRVEYPFEMRNRQRIEEIVKRLGKDVPAELMTALGKIDRQLRGIGKPSLFVWDARVEAVYPRETYWYLYQRP
jgi:hypothetical protein